MALILLAGCPFVAITAPARGNELYRTARQLTAKYGAELEELASWCEERGLAEQAQKTRTWLRPRDPHKLYVAVLPQKVGWAKLPDDAPDDVVQWDTRFGRRRRQQADALFELAQRAIRNGRASLALELVLWAIHENPDHERVRRLMGYQKYRGGWHTAYEVRKLRAGEVWHEKFGWLPEANVRRYEQGKRLVDGRWITAEEDARLHQDIRSGWVIETENYSIRTNHSRQAAVELSVKLQELYRVWKQLFVRFYASEAQVSAWFAGRTRQRIAMPRHHVVYFRDRADYNLSLRPSMPNIEISIGVYVENARRAYFFAGGDHDRRTLLHEATHQLFHESRRAAPSMGGRANFWIIEGIAMYMESLQRQDAYYVLGGFDDARMVAAKYRLLHDDFYVPLDELTSYGMEKIQADPRIATLYSQAAGLTHFLIHYDCGRYRDAVIAYLSTVYSGRDTPDTLAQLTVTSYGKLDEQYRQYIKSGP